MFSQIRTIVFNSYTRLSNSNIPYTSGQCAMNPEPNAAYSICMRARVPNVRTIEYVASYIASQLYAPRELLIAHIILRIGPHVCAGRRVTDSWLSELERRARLKQCLQRISAADALDTGHCVYPC